VGKVAQFVLFCNTHWDNLWLQETVRRHGAII
jgi:hypothetical protein